MEQRKSTLISLEEMIKITQITDAQMHVSEKLHSYLFSSIISMTQVLIYKSTTCHTKLIQSLMDLFDFCW